MADVKKIAMIYREVGTCGGIQRGASFQVDQFRSWGYEPIVLTESELGIGDTRQARLEALLLEHKPDLVIEHDAYVVSKLAGDIAAARTCGIPIVVFWHSVFSWMMARGLPETQKVWAALDQADAIIALSQTDETFFRLRGNRALAIPYCDVDIMKGFARACHPHRLVWMGRFVDLKRPMDAIRILEKVRDRVPDAELDMLGSFEPDKMKRIQGYLDKRPVLRSAVHFLGFQRDVRPYLERAGVGLVTSQFEGYCHSIVEMQMASLPVVSYSMTYLETLNRDSGAFQVPQGDVGEAAARVVDLMQNAELCVSEGRKARAAYERRDLFGQREAYESLFGDIARPLAQSALIEPQAQFVKGVVSVLAEHAVMGFAVVGNREKKACSSNRGIKGLFSKIWPFKV